MVRVFGGAVLVLAGIAAFIEAHSNRPIPGERLPTHVPLYIAVGGLRGPSGLSQTAYDLLRIGGCALLVIGVLLIIVGLIAYMRRPETGDGR